MKWLGIITAGLAVTVIVLLLRSCGCISPLGKPTVQKALPLEKYTYANLKQTRFSGSPITIDKVIRNGDGYRSRLFYFRVDGKKVSGLINLPDQSGDRPIIVMVRGYVDPKIYQTGVGTQHGGEYLAQNGFITLAPDFLGYGESDAPNVGALEERFLTYTTVLQLLASVQNLNAGLEAAGLPARVDASKIGLWGHSNGGQIVLSVLEISGKPYPTVLWAPVSKPFPYSILYYTDDVDDHGKALRKLVADFEKNYNAENYSLTNYLGWIRAPIQLHQGETDPSVPLAWSNDLYHNLQQKQVKVEYFTYPGEDHNFSQGSWPLVMQRTADFFTNL
ncbi:prolyl oligopeptidase family serine peptidase [Patescibacteria group bacterium]|nr:prolyl oligopeptidase family serine peptidase [Patescibacteria group bacterium]MCL5091353.1 prolyl oligopeptidase family serine peptidase [Patescibacteria group bacterium]